MQDVVLRAMKQWVIHLYKYSREAYNVQQKTSKRGRARRSDRQVNTNQKITQMILLLNGIAKGAIKDKCVRLGEVRLWCWLEGNGKGL